MKDSNFKYNLNDSVYWIRKDYSCGHLDEVFLCKGCVIGTVLETNKEDVRKFYKTQCEATKRAESDRWNNSNKFEWKDEEGSLYATEAEAMKYFEDACKELSKQYFKNTIVRQESMLRSFDVSIMDYARNLRRIEEEKKQAKEILENCKKKLEELENEQR